MADETVTLADIIDQEKEQLELFGNETAQFFTSLSDGIKSEFLGNLNQLVSSDLKNFQQNVTGMLAQTGLNAISPYLTQGLGDLFGSVLGSGLGNVIGNSAGSAISGALSGFIRTGSFDPRSIANASGGMLAQSIAPDAFATAQSNMRGELKLSDGQQAAEASKRLQRGQRNN